MMRLFTCGYEFEYEQCMLNNQDKLLLQYHGYDITKDQSVESILNTFCGVPTYSDTILNYDRSEFGGEINSPPFDIRQKEWKEHLSALLNVFSKESSFEGSSRCSIHYHIYVQTCNLFELQNMIAVGVGIESMMYRLSGLLMPHRGETNNFNYCRPLISPPVVKTEKGLGFIFEYEQLLKAETTIEFWNKYCDASNHGDNKYNPARYTWLNLFSVYNKRQTLEFRPFNQTLLQYNIEAIFELCKTITEIMLKVSWTEIANKLSITDIGDVFHPDENRDYKLLDYITDFFDNQQYKNRILYLFENSTYPVFKPEPVLSHMVLKNDVIYYRDEEYCPEVISEDKVLAPIYIEKRNFDIENYVTKKKDAFLRKIRS